MVDESPTGQREVKITAEGRRRAKQVLETRFYSAEFGELDSDEAGFLVDEIIAALSSEADRHDQHSA